MLSRGARSTIVADPGTDEGVNACVEVEENSLSEAPCYVETATLELALG